MILENTIKLLVRLKKPNKIITNQFIIMTIQIQMKCLDSQNKTQFKMNTTRTCKTRIKLMKTLTMILLSNQIDLSLTTYLAARSLTTNLLFQETTHL